MRQCATTTVHETNSLRLFRSLGLVTGFVVRPRQRKVEVRKSTDYPRTSRVIFQRVVYWLFTTATPQAQLFGTTRLLVNMPSGGFVFTTGWEVKVVVYPA